MKNKKPCAVEVMEMYMALQKVYESHRDPREGNFLPHLEKILNIIHMSYEWKKHRSKASEEDLLNALNEGESY